MDYPYLERPVQDDADEIPTEVEIDEVGVRMECLKLALEHGQDTGLSALQSAEAFAAFVIHGTVPKPN